ncbi:hypothetical protein [Streptomyces sp. NPDC051642]|uniref:hypothetical protein n=1 Tax=unclassified Streptomyces TaxID=2593676 RepID=UPI00343A585D
MEIIQFLGVQAGEGQVEGARFHPDVGEPLRLQFPEPPPPFVCDAVDLTLGQIAFSLAKEAARARGVMIPEAPPFRHLRDFMDAVLIASGVPPRSVRIRMRHGTLAMTPDTYGFALEVDWENAPASFEELFGTPAPPGLPEAALVPRVERIRREVRRGP